MARLTSIILLCWVLSLSASEAQTIPGCNSLQFRIEQIDENHIRLTGEVEIACGELKYYADEVDLFTDTNELIASGNVVYTSGRRPNRSRPPRVRHQDPHRNVSTTRSGPAFIGDQAGPEHVRQPGTGGVLLG